ncbi:MAG: NUDIX domain-containing protein [Hyphomicrobiales bacterium]|nr:NUDIX domain-containing protein [Hyphomicrobiales bacterium]
MAERTLLPAVSIAIQRNDTLLLVRRGRRPSQGYYAFPGGRVEAGESLEEAVRRELAEETGLAVETLSALVRLQVAGDDIDYDLQVFFAHYAGGEPVADDDAEEAAFFTLADMQQLDVLESVLAVARDLLGK